MSEVFPNQDFIATLDESLADLPKDIYIEKLIEMTNDSENIITWYRTFLAGRAKSIQGCPLGKLITRKSTNKSTSIQKYARDCYTLYMFINGDNTGIEELFRKEECKSVSESSTLPSINMVELRATLQSALERISQLEQSELENKKSVKYLKTENDKLKQEVSDMRKQIEDLSPVIDRKIVQYDANFKIVNQQCKAIGEFNFDSYTSYIEKTSSELERLGKLQMTLQKTVNEMRLSLQKPYAEKVSSVSQPEPRNKTKIK